MMIICDNDVYAPSYANDGCNGGDLKDAWDFVAVYGLVSDACSPTRTLPVACTMRAGYAPATANQCTAGTNTVKQANTFAVPLTSERTL